MMEFLQMAMEHRATDLHVASGGGVYERRLGKIFRVGDCTVEQFQAMDQQLFAHRTHHGSIVNKAAEKVKDFSAVFADVGRLRVRRYHAQGQRCLAIRLLPERVPEPEELGWPQAVLPVCQERQGLVLVTGASGSGKSTTLAAMLEQINRTRACHILTYEAPVEYLFHNEKAMIHQCAVPEDVPSFAAGATEALRLDADVIMLGELTDQETMRAAIKLAESGHLVLATMHTGAAVEAVGYFINHFPTAQQPLVCHQLAATLRAVISQRLLPHRNEERLVASFEILLQNTAVARQIREQDLSQLAASMELGRSEGMVMMEESLAALVREGAIAFDDALRAANMPERLRKLLAR